LADNVRDVLPLIGYMDEQSARDFLTEDCVPTKPPEEVNALIKACRAAALRKEVPDLEAKTMEIPAEADGLLSEIKRDERLPTTVEMWKWSFREVQIDKLVCIQRYVDIPYADEVSGRLDLGTVEGRIKFCLTDEFRSVRSEIFAVPKDHLFAIKGEGNDMRVVRSGATLDAKTGDRTVSFTVGWGNPFVQVAKLRGRYILKNGYHRAFALRKRGLEYLPCILLEIDAYGDLECKGPPTYFSEKSIMGAHPPLFASFFDPEIAPPMKMNSFANVVVIRPDVTILDPEGMVGYLSNVRAEGLNPHPDNLEYIDVRPRHEDWNVYRLADGTTLKMRAMLTRVKRPQPNAPRGGADISNIMLVCNPAKGTKGPPEKMRPTPDELTAAIVDRDVRFKVISEPTSEYVTEEGKRILLRLKLFNLARTSKYDHSGDPLYLFNAKPELILVDS
jgi:hypothetical protein